MSINFVEIKLTIDIFIEEYNIHYEDLFEQCNFKLYNECELKITNFILNLIKTNNIAISKEIIKCINSKNSEVLLELARQILYRKENHESLKLHKDNETFIMFFKNINLGCGYYNNYKFDYKDYEFYNHLSKISDEAFTVIAFDKNHVIHKTPITNELVFLIDYYEHKIFLLKCFKEYFTDKEKFLEYFEKVCSTTDFSDEYL